jgi:hypothetical protein
MTELSKYGIAMAADSAVTQETYSYDTSQLKHRIYLGARKLRPIPKISAGISIWGNGKVGYVDTDIWIKEFISREEKNYSSLADFADHLTRKLNEIGGSTSGSPTLGFHLAGYQKAQNGKFSCCYQIFDGFKEGFRNQLAKPPRNYSGYRPEIIRGGDYFLGAKLFDLQDRYLSGLRKAGLISVPYPEDLKMRAEYLRFQIVHISHLYRLSSRFPFIGGPVTTLTISSRGIQEYETRGEIINPYYDTGFI